MRSLKSLKYMDWLSVFMGCLGLIFVVFPKFITLAGIALFGFIIAGYVKKELKFKWTKLSTLLVLLYLVYLVSAFWTTDAHLAGKYLEYKLSLVIFPILFSFKSKDPLPPSPLIWGWLIGVTVVSIIGLSVGWSIYRETGNMHSFMSSSISTIHHPTYFTAFSTLLLGLLWWANSKKIRGFNRWWLIPYTVWSLIHHFMLMSLAGVGFLLLLIVVLIFVFTYKLWGKYALILLIILIPIIGAFIAKNVDVIQYQVHGVTYFTDDYISDPIEFVKSRNEVMSGNEIRLVLWTVASQEFASNPIGAGVGSMEARMAKRLRSYGRNALADSGMNPHNQYLQMGIEIGVIGLFLFLFLLAYLCFKAIQTKNYLLLLLVLNLAFNCLFESMIQRQSGIVFYTFWLCFLTLFLPVSTKNKG